MPGMFSAVMDILVVLLYRQVHLVVLLVPRCDELFLALIPLSFLIRIRVVKQIS